MTPSPNPPPRGGAEPRVSAADLALTIKGFGEDAEEWSAAEPWLDLRDARAEIADLRAKLEAAEAERDAAREIVNHGQTSIAAETERWKFTFSVERARAEAALREMTEQRDGVWKAGLDVLSSLVAAAHLLKNGGKKAAASNKMFDQMLIDYEASIDRGRTALAPPAETAASAARLAGPSPNVGGGDVE